MGGPVPPSTPDDSKFVDLSGSGAHGDVVPAVWNLQTGHKPLAKMLARWRNDSRNVGEMFLHPLYIQKEKIRDCEKRIPRLPDSPLPAAAFSADSSKLLAVFRCRLLRGSSVRFGPWWDGDDRDAFFSLVVVEWDATTGDWLRSFDARIRNMQMHPLLALSHDSSKLLVHYQGKDRRNTKSTVDVVIWCASGAMAGRPLEVIRLSQEFVLRGDRPGPPARFPDEIEVQKVSGVFSPDGSKVFLRVVIIINTWRWPRRLGDAMVESISLWSTTSVTALSDEQIYDTGSWRDRNILFGNKLWSFHDHVWKRETLQEFNPAGDTANHRLFEHLIGRTSSSRFPPVFSADGSKVVIVSRRMDAFTFHGLQLNHRRLRDTSDVISRALQRAMVVQVVDVETGKRISLGESDDGHLYLYQEQGYMDRDGRDENLSEVGFVRGTSISRSGETVYTKTNFTLKKWDANTGHLLHTFSLSGQSGEDHSVEGALLAGVSL